MTGRWIVATTTAMWVATLAAQEPTPVRQREIVQLLRQDCSACHGLTLRGGLGPALTAQALMGKPSAMLRDTILNGRPGTPMAPWRPFLTEVEAAWLAQRLLQGMSDAP